jgi:glycerol-3-phosphate responsive antiterminator
MGSFTKNFRKRVVKTQLKQSKQINLYLMQRVSTLMDEVALAKAKSPAADLLHRMELMPGITSCAPVKREESLERYDNPEVR